MSRGRPIGTIPLAAETNQRHCMTYQNKHAAGYRIFTLGYFAIGVTLLALVAYTLWMAFYLPVYGDETYWKLIVSRLVSDDGYLIYLFSQCAHGQWIQAPLTWLPAMALSSLLYENASHPWMLRISGWLLYVGLLIAWIWLLKRRSGLSWFDSALAVFAFFSFGVLPFLMVFDRPEKTLLVLLTLVLALVPTGESSQPKPSKVTAIFWVVLFSLLAALFAGVHPKGLFFFPALLAVLCVRTRSWIAGLLFLVVLAWIARDTMAIWQARTHCPEFPGLMTVLQNLTLRPTAFFADPGAFIHAAWLNLRVFDAYVDSIGLMPAYVENWLPAAAGGMTQQGWVMLVNALNWIPLAAAAGLTLVNLVRAGSKWWKSTGLVWLTVCLALIFIVCLQTAKNFYEASLVWPLIGVVTVLSFAPSGGQKPTGGAKALILLLVVIAIISSVARIDRFAPNLSDWIGERTWQVQHQDQHNETLREFARNSCAIDASAVRLAIDKTTYPAFWRHRQPILLDFSSGWWAAEADLSTTLRNKKSEGLVAACERLSDDLRARAKTQGQVCCLSAEDLR